MSEPLSEVAFDRWASEELSALDKVLGHCDGIEVDLEMGVMTIEFSDGAKYVINSHRAAKQIWMAAERTAWHFDRTPEGMWVASKSGSELWDTLAQSLSKKLMRDVALPRAL